MDVVKNQTYNACNPRSHTAVRMPINSRGQISAHSKPWFRLVSKTIDHKCMPLFIAPFHLIQSNTETTALHHHIKPKSQHSEPSKPITLRHQAQSKCFRTFNILATGKQQKRKPPPNLHLRTLAKHRFPTDLEVASSSHWPTSSTTLRACNASGSRWRCKCAADCRLL